MSYDRIASLLASNLKPTQVASIVGLSPARIAQLQKDESFMSLVQAKQALHLKEADEEETITAKYSAAEHMLLNQMMELIPISEMRDVTQALKVVAERQEKAKTRIAPIFQGTVVNSQTIIKLQLPNHAIPEIQMSSNKEVISIGEQELAPLPSSGVTDLFKTLKDKGDYHVQDITTEKASSFITQTLPAFTEVTTLEGSANEF